MQHLNGRARTSNSPSVKQRPCSPKRHARWLVLAAAPVAMALASRATAAAVDTWAGANSIEWGGTGNFTGGNSPPQAGDILSFTNAGTVMTSDDNLGNAFLLGGLNFNTGAGAYNVTSDLGVNDQSLVLTGPLIDNAANSTTQTLNFGVNSSSGLVLGSDASQGNVLALNASSNFAYFNVSTNTTSATPVADALIIGTGSTVTINGQMMIGVQSSSGVSNSNFNSYAGATGIQGSGGILTVNGSLIVGGANTNSTSTKDNTIADFSSYSGLNVNAPTGVLGIGYGQNTKGVLLLPSGPASANFINVGAIDMGTSNIGPDGSTLNSQPGSMLSLGTGTNTIEASTINLGAGKSNGVINFQYSAGSVSISGTNGTGTAAITIGNENVGSATATTTPSGLLLAGHQATVLAGPVVVGNGADGNTAVAVANLTFDTGTFNASSFTVASVSVGPGVIGSVTIGSNSSSTGIVNDSGAFVLGNNSGGTTTTANLTINGGTVNLASGIAVLSTKNTTTAAVNLSGGLLNLNGFGIGTPTAVGTTLTVNLPTSGQTATLVNLGGSGIYASAGTGSTGNAGGLTMGGTGTLILAGTNNNFSGATTINSGGTLQIGSGALGGSVPAASTFTNNGTLNFAGSLPINISNGISGSGNLNHNSTSTTTLSGSNTYSGGTSINSGVLAVTGSLLTSGTVNVSGGTLAGTGPVGNVIMTSGAIHPGASGADFNIGTLSVSSLSDTGGDMRFDLGGSSSDLITDAGSASFSGATVSLMLDSAPTVSSYTILTAAGGITGIPTLTTNSIGRTTFFLSDIGNSLVITVGGGPANLIWGKLATGTGDGVTWDSVQANQNWKNGSSPDTFYKDDLVTFNDTNNGHTTVTISGQVSPGSVTFSNNTSSYIVNGTGGINGSTGLLMNGTGSVTLQTANTYIGDTNINSGTLILGTGGSIADTNFNVNGGVLNIAGGNLLSTNLNVNSGSVNLSGGTLSSPNTTVASGASFLLAGGTILPTSVLTVNGTAALAVPSTVGILNGTGIVNLNGNLLTAPVGGTFGGVLQDGSGSGGLNVPSGTFTLTGSSTYSGTTSTSGTGVLQIGNGGTTGSINAASPIVSNGTVAFNNSGSVSVNNTITGTGVIQQGGLGSTLVGGNISGFTGAFNITAGTLIFNYSSPTITQSINGAGPGAIANIGKLILSGTETISASTLTFNVSPFSGLLSDGVAADVEVTGSINKGAGTGIVLSGLGTLALSGNTDDASLGATVNSGTLLLNKNSSATVHSIGGSGLTINSGGTVEITGTGGDQIYNGGGIVKVNDGGLFEMNGQSESIFGLTIGSSATGAGATLSDDVPNSHSTLTTGNGATGALAVAGNTNFYAASGATLELTVNGVANGSGATRIATLTGPGTVILDGTVDNSNMAVNVSSGTLILAKINSSNGAHAVNSIYLVNPGAMVQMGSSGSGGDQIYDGYYTTSNPANWGVLNMNGTFDMNGMSEGFDKLTGTGSVINSQTSNSVLTLGTDDLIGNVAPLYAGTISGNITLNLNVSQGSTTPFVLTGSNSYTGGTNIINGVLEVGNGTPSGSVGTGPITIAANMTLALNRTDTALVIPGSISGAGNLFDIGSGTVTLAGVNTYTGPTFVNAGTLKLAVAGALPFATPGFNGTDLSIAGGASVVAAHLATPTAIQLDSLNNSGLIDLNNNGMDLYVGNASLSTIWSQIQTGYNGGAWNGTSGIISTDAANNARHLTALGVITNDNGQGTPLYGTGGVIATSFEGVVPQDGDVLVKYTYYGDTNLNGKVDGTDYSRIDAAVLANESNPGSATGWYNGDFNYDGVIDGSDYTLIDNAFNTQGAILAEEIASPTAQISGTAGSSSVPEPATLGLLAMGAAGLLGSRRRRN